MSTPATIGIERKNGLKTFITVNFDGYMEHTGKMLLKHYNTTEAIEELLALGDLSSIGETLDECIAYNRDRNESWEETMPRTHTLEQEKEARYAAHTYIWNGQDWTKAEEVIKLPA